MLLDSSRTALPDERIPSLDGLRALAIGLVLADHIGWGEYAPPALSWFARVARAGDLGVRLFFVISGFLITTLLRQEYEHQGTISLRRFYFRRTLRIMPPFFFFMAIYTITGAAKVVPWNPSDALYAWTLTMNFHNDEVVWTLAHLWSLSVEEQFYLLWPGLMLFVGLRRASALLAAVVVASAGWHLASYLYLTTPSFELRHTFRGVAQWLAAGALLALWRKRLHAIQWYRDALGHPGLPVVLVIGIGLAWTGIGYWRRSDLTIAGAVFGTALLIDWAMTHPRALLAAPLNWRPMVWIGRISYSLYLWQQPLVFDHSTSVWLRPPQALLLLIPLAALSYYGIELPTLGVRRRWERRLWPSRASAPAARSD
jgi:peptidoglycan/LPS O-acetylase OafA/YrhL